MTDVRDDPREVLALLNSLGFVGITAQQLKAFMKDLKMHRKIKERERQQWKEETRKKIISKQENLLKELLRETLVAERVNSSDNTLSSRSSLHEDSLLFKIKVNCVPDDDSNNDIENSTGHNVQSPPPSRQVCVKTSRLCRQEFNRNINGPSTCKEKSLAKHTTGHTKNNEKIRAAEVPKDSSQCILLEKKTDTATKETQQIIRPVIKENKSKRPLSAPVLIKEDQAPKQKLKSVTSDPTGLGSGRNNPSRCSTHSNTKSFIRPWRLQPEAQRASQNRKCDPVALYQKYQQEWKQISFPGEDQHARVRWAVREKMLGIDPNPRPILKNSQSLLSIKKR